MFIPLAAIRKLCDTLYTQEVYRVGASLITFKSNTVGGRPPLVAELPTNVAHADGGTLG